MSKRAEQLLAQVLDLSPDERAQIAEHLLTSLNLSTIINKLWAQEAESRIDAYEQGEIKAVSAQDVFENADSL